jgi:hypothetical protein
MQACYVLLALDFGTTDFPNLAYVFWHVDDITTKRARYYGLGHDLLKQKK